MKLWVYEHLAVRDRSTAYVAAAGVILVAATVRLALHPVLESSAPYVVFYPAMLLAVIIGGSRPGALSILPAFIFGRLFAGPLFEPPDGAEAFTIALFFVAAAMIWFMGSALRDARDRMACALGRYEDAQRELAHKVGNILAICAATLRLQDRDDLDQAALRDQALERIQALAEEGHALTPRYEQGRLSGPPRCRLAPAPRPRARRQWEGLSAARRG